VEEKKPTRIPLVAASEPGKAQAFNLELLQEWFMLPWRLKISSRIVVSERNIEANQNPFEPKSFGKGHHGG